MNNKFFYSEITVKSPFFVVTFLMPGKVDCSFKIAGEEEFRKFVSQHDNPTKVKVSTKVFEVGHGYARKTFSDDIRNVEEAISLGVHPSRFRRLYKCVEFETSVFPQLLVEVD